MRIFLCLLAITMFAIGCQTVKPYEKEYLLHPLMDDDSLASLNSSFVPTVQAKVEKLSGAGSAGNSSTSCPTCGG